MEAGPTTPGAVPGSWVGWAGRRGEACSPEAGSGTFVTMVDPPWGPVHVQRADAGPGSETEGFPAGSHGRRGAEGALWSRRGRGAGCRRPVGR